MWRQMTMSAAAGRALRELERLSRSGLDTRAFRHASLRQVQRMGPADAVWFATVDPTTLLFTSAVVDEVLRTKAVFDKFGVHSRGQLVSGILGSH
jgi:hypothetical protein